MGGCSVRFLARLAAGALPRCLGFLSLGHHDRPLHVGEGRGGGVRFLPGGNTWPGPGSSELHSVAFAKDVHTLRVVNVE